MNIKWFIRKGIFFFPVSLIGWIISVAAVGYCIYLFIDIDSRSHSVSDTLMNFVFNVFNCRSYLFYCCLLYQQKNVKSQAS